jgi:serine/threonine protein kinase
MGVVFLGRDPVIGRRVALKTIRPSTEDDPDAREFAERFLREAQAAGTLSHPNIVTIHDVGEEVETGTSFIAMEYVEGENLKQILKDKVSLSYDRIAEIVNAVADALDYAHRRGIVHRDVKPANIILTPDGTVKIMDFGIAKMESSSLTATGQFLGTPNYMSPEQVTGEAVDGRSDLFSLGVVLYELLTKKKPFAGDNLTSISYKIVHEEFPSPQTYDAAIPAEFNPILARALAKDPADRFQSGKDFVRALSEFRGRHAEMEMLKDLGEMVAQAERLGPVSAVESKEISPGPVATSPAPAATSPAPGPASPAPFVRPGGSTSIEDLARHGRSELDPSLAANAPSAGSNESSGPNWSLDTGALTPSPAPKGRENAAPREAAASSPGTLISDVQRGIKPATERDSGPVKPPEHPPGPAVAASDPLSQLTERIVTIPSNGPLPQVTERIVMIPPPASPARPPARAGPLVSPAVRPAPTFPKPQSPAPPVESMGEPPRVAKAGRDITRPIQPARPAGSVGPPARPLTGRPASPPRAPGRDITGPVAMIPPRAGPPTSGKVNFAPGPQPPLENEKVPDILKRDVNRRFVALIVIGAVLLALAVVGVLVQRSRAIAGKAADEAAARETLARRRLLEDGSRMLAEGRPAEARAAFLELVRQAPDSPAARAALGKAEAALVKKDEDGRRLAEVGARLAVAREARDAKDFSRVVAEADAVLALAPDSAEATELKAAALEEVAKQGRGSQKNAVQKTRPARSVSKGPAAVPTAAPEPIAVAPKPEPSPAPTPTRVRLRIAVTVPAPQGYVMVRRNDVEVFRRTFDFGRKSGGGSLDGEIDLPTGPAQFKAWVIATDRSVNQYKVVTLTLGSDGRTLTLDVDAAKGLTVTLR